MSTLTHDPDALDVEGCDACLEIVTDPRRGSTFPAQVQAFADANHAHFGSPPRPGPRR